MGKCIYLRKSYGREYYEVGVRINGPYVYGGTFPLSQLNKAKESRDRLLAQRKPEKPQDAVDNAWLKTAWR